MHYNWCQFRSKQNDLLAAWGKVVRLLYISNVCAFFEEHATKCVWDLPGAFQFHCTDLCQVHFWAISGINSTVSDCQPARMSRDSAVASLPSQGWSCETLVEGVRTAAQMSGLAIQPSQLDQARIGGTGAIIDHWMKLHEHIFLQLHALDSVGTVFVCFTSHPSLKNAVCCMWTGCPMCDGSPDEATAGHSGGSLSILKRSGLIPL